MRKQIAIPVSDSSLAAEARRMAMNLAQSLGFDETGAGKVAIVVTEAAKNLAKYATGGELLLRPLERSGINGLEIMTLDRGPGMANVSQCLVDGYSTSGSPGQGLGAISRICSLFDIHSAVGSGTALVARLWAKPLPKNLPGRRLETGVVCLPKPGEEVSGDDWAVDHRPGFSLLLVADGLGHGLMAAEASAAAIKIFKKNTHLDPARMVEAIHSDLRSMRGAVVAVVKVDMARQLVLFTGVGNISGCILSAEENIGLTSYNGTVGREVSKIREFTYPWPEGAMLIMHSDGLATHWKLSQYPGLIRRHPSLIAGVLYRDYNRGNDDVTVLVAKGVKEEIR